MKKNSAFKLRSGNKPSMAKLSGVEKSPVQKNSDAGAAFNPNTVKRDKLSKEEIKKRTSEIQAYYNQQKKRIAQEKADAKRKAEVEKKNKEFIKKHGPYVQGGPIGSGEVLPGALD
tara:strand:- start:73 stop:420 length:348 start_codon:yes stop_codon:yes gene_type:complete